MGIENLSYFIGVESKEDVKKHYRKLTFKHHPDKGGNAEDFREVTRQYLFIKDCIDKITFPIEDTVSYTNSMEDYYSVNRDMEEAQAWYASMMEEKEFDEDGVFKGFYDQYVKAPHLTSGRVNHVINVYFVEADNEYKGGWTKSTRKGLTRIGEGDDRATKVYVRLLNYCRKFKIVMKEDYIIVIANYYGKDESWVKAVWEGLNKMIGDVLMIETNV